MSEAEKVKKLLSQAQLDFIKADVFGSHGMKKAGCPQALCFLLIRFECYKHIGFEPGKPFTIIPHDVEDFKEIIGNRIEKLVEVEYAFQELENLPGGFKNPEGRTKLLMLSFSYPVPPIPVLQYLSKYTSMKCFRSQIFCVCQLWEISLFFIPSPLKGTLHCIAGEKGNTGHAGFGSEDLSAASAESESVGYGCPPEPSGCGEGYCVRLCSFTVQQKFFLINT